MGRAAGVARRRKKTANIKRRSRKTLKKVRKQQLKKTGGIACDELREEWNMQRSMKTNMSKMGLSHDPNYTMAKETREKKKQKMIDMFEITEIKKPITEFKKPKTVTNEDTKVIEALEKKASIPRQKNFRFGPDSIEFCIYMIDKYDNDYEAMQRDKRNHYQESAGQIRTKIKKFLTIPEHMRTYEKVMDMFEEKYAEEMAT